MLTANRERIQQGVLAALDEKQAESQVSAQRSLLLTAQRNVSLQENVMKGLLSDNLAEWADVSIQPSGDLVAVSQKMLRNESWQHGLANRPDLLQAREDLERLGYIVKYNRNQLFPQLESDKLTQKASLATLKSDSEQARLVAEADENLSKRGLVPVLTAKQSGARANDLIGRVEIEEERKRIAEDEDSTKAQIAAAEAELEKTRALFAMKKRQMAALEVRAGIDGVLQQIGGTQTLQVGQRIRPSATLARIVQPTKLKAEMKIAETQAKDVLTEATRHRARLCRRPAAAPLQDEHAAAGRGRHSRAPTSLCLCS